MKFNILVFPRPRVLVSAFAGAVLLAATLFLVNARAAPAAQAISNVLITDVRDGSFVVSWVTDTLTDGHVDWGTSTPPGMTVSDSEVSTTTHYVTISGLSADTTHFFQIRSGSTTDDNGGAYYSVTTGNSFLPQAPGRIVFGTMFEANGTTPVENAIVYIRVRDNDGSDSAGNSQWGSARTNASGIWFFELNNLRTEDAGAAFEFSNDTDEVQFVWQGGVYGLVGESGDERVYAAPNDYPAEFDMALDADPTSIQLIRLGGFTGGSIPTAILLSAAAGVGLVAVSWVVLRKRRAKP
jgi:hypothetical protein